MKKVLPLVAVGALFSLVGCGGGDDSSAGGDGRICRSYNDYTLCITSQTWTPSHNEVGQLLYSGVIRGTASGPVGATLAVANANLHATPVADSWSGHAGPLEPQEVSGDPETTTWTVTVPPTGSGIPINIYLMARVVTSTMVVLETRSP